MASVEDVVCGMDDLGLEHKAEDTVKSKKKKKRNKKKKSSHVDSVFDPICQGYSVKVI